MDNVGLELIRVADKPMERAARRGDGRQAGDYLFGAARMIMAEIPATLTEACNSEFKLAVSWSIWLD